MAQKQLITFVDDLDGTEATGTYRVYDRLGHPYEVDLNDTNAEALKAALEAVATFCEKGRRLAAGKGPQRTRALTLVPAVAGTNGAVASPGAIREWAALHEAELTSKGIAQPSDRGRIPSAVVEAYNDRQHYGAVKAPEAPAAPEPTPAPAAAFQAATEAPKPKPVAKRPAAKRTAKRGNLA